jgi:hypothetical protein
VVNANPRPLYPREREPVPILQEAGWAPRPVWKGAKYLAPHQDFFCILLCSVCTSAVLVSSSWLSCIFPFVFYVQHTTQTSMPRTRFETPTPASNRPQTIALDLSETAIGKTHRKSNTRPSGFSAVPKPTELERARIVFQFRKTLISCLDVLSYKRIQIRSPDRSAHSESQYRLSRPGPPTNHAVMGNYVINVAKK